MNETTGISASSIITLRVIIIGAGTSVPVTDHSPASVYVRCGSFSALMDIGPGTLSKLPLYGVDAFGLENIFITHLHPDHVLDLATLYQISNYAPDQRKDNPLDIFGCQGISGFINELMSLFPDIDVPSFAVHVHELAKSRIEKKGVAISSTLSGHTKNSIAFRLEFNPGIVVYTGDCVKNDEVIKLCENADLLISECSFPDDWTTKDHMNARDLGKLACSANVRQLVVVHQYPPALKTDLASQISQYFSGPILIAKDGTRVSLNLSSKAYKKR